MTAQPPRPRSEQAPAARETSLPERPLAGKFRISIAEQASALVALEATAIAVASAVLIAPVSRPRTRATAPAMLRFTQRDLSGPSAGMARAFDAVASGVPAP